MLGADDKRVPTPNGRPTCSPPTLPIVATTNVVVLAGTVDPFLRRPSRDPRLTTDGRTPRYGSGGPGSWCHCRREVGSSESGIPGILLSTPPPAEDLRGLDPGARRADRRGPAVVAHTTAGLRPGARPKTRPDRKPGPARARAPDLRGGAGGGLAWGTAERAVPLVTGDNGTVTRIHAVETLLQWI